MPLPHLHVFLRNTPAGDYLLPWLAAVEALLRGDANWDGCEFHRHAIDAQAAIDIPTAVGHILETPGPIIILGKIQAARLDRLRKILERRISIYSLEPRCEEDFWEMCEAARLAFEDGQPRIPQRELIAYLIIRKLERLGMWGGLALNKGFLWGGDLPKGGFPKEYSDDRLVMQVADVLVGVNVLQRKQSESTWKYALGEKSVVDPILATKAFDGFPTLRKYFDKSQKLLPANLLDYNDG